MRKLRVLDLFCGAGGAGEGYRRLGMDVTGVDKFAQPENPHRFIQSDWESYLLEHGHEYDLIHTSPVCKGYANVNSWAASTHARQIPIVRKRLIQLGKPYVIENVYSARWDMENPVQVCGSVFGLRVRRHRLFESNMELEGSGCDHKWQDASKIYLRRGRYSRPTASGVCPVNGDGKQLLNVTTARELELRSQAMGIDWMSWTTLTQAIPPAFTEFIGAQILEQMK